jgi:nitrite reductase/ring-hydroxylating ferredoxin subunit
MHHSVVLETSDGLRVTSDAAVLATHAPINDVVGYVGKLSTFRSYVIGMRLPRDRIASLLAYDTAEPYHYVRIQPVDDHDVLIVGGEDHLTGQGDGEASPFDALEQWARTMFPMADPVEYRWSGQVRNSFDGLGMIGRDLVDKQIYVITGQTGIGMTHSTLGGIIVSDLIDGRSNPWANLYDPGRLSLDAVKDMIQEGLYTISEFREWFTPSETSNEAAIPLHSGAVVGWGLGKRAVYRDSEGDLHRYTATCSHMGCVVGWNDIEKSWDCPCHGSRYDAHGRVINGPASHDLDPVGQTRSADSRK